MGKSSSSAPDPLNLLSNAVKYTEDGGRIRFCVHKEAEDENSMLFVFTVEDTGIGMSPEYMDHLFEAFTQEHRQARTTYRAPAWEWQLPKTGRSAGRSN